MDLEHVACKLCGKDDAAVLFSRRDELTRRETEFRVVRCRECGLVYVNPRPTPREIGAFYPPEFVSYQFEPVPVGRTPGVADRLLAFITGSVAAQRVSAVRKFRPLAQGSKAIDVGCGKGGFLARLAREFGCDVTGVDFDAATVDYCRDTLGIRAIHGGVGDLAALEGQFDLVTMWHFLEHEYEPQAALAAARRLLRPGGALVVEVPNAASLENSVFRSRSYLYDVPRHLYDFTPDTLRRLIEAAGLSSQRLEFPTRAGGWVGSLQSVLSGGAVYRDVKRHLVPFLLLAQLSLPLDFLSARLGRGSIMTLFATKG